MLQNPSHLAAIRLHESDIITGEKIGSSYFFHPNDTVTRGEFLAMAVAAGGYDLYHTDRTDFMDDDAISSWAKPYISTAACNGLVQGYRAVNGASEIRAGNFITLDEASSIICSLIKPYLDDPIAASVDTGSTHWAAAANTILDAVDILPSTHMKSGSEPITRQTACDLIYSALKIMQ